MHLILTSSQTSIINIRQRQSRLGSYWNNQQYGTPGRYDSNIHMWRSIYLSKRPYSIDNTPLLYDYAQLSFLQLSLTERTQLFFNCSLRRTLFWLHSDFILSDLRANASRPKSVRVLVFIFMMMCYYFHSYSTVVRSIYHLCGCRLPMVLVDNVHIYLTRH